ncbi:hypothetical protein ADINL_2344 [Nitrincola lacisaponensis]|uniref:Tryptophan synthase subunit beta like protein n=1 Tax=Nitrincola lacisaponensis TaxID=267850 RepID=A0A063Y226_9GAMM|nr:hypothetical protein [Nitrincola lacisaponensis]KDE39215.1 hypothetical protein ADINL_2344 [Nitrincola lacisaponensis]
MFIKRNHCGKIVGISETQSVEFPEAADDRSEEFLDYLKCEACKATVAQTTLERSDTELVRVLEDVIDLLTHKGVIQFTDLPKAAQQKLLNRQNLRENHRSLKLIGDDEDEDSLRFL